MLAKHTAHTAQHTGRPAEKEPAGKNYSSGSCIGLPTGRAVMSVLSRADAVADPWAAMSVSLEADQQADLETTPLNSPEKHERGSRTGSRSSASPVLRREATSHERSAAEEAAHDAGIQGVDLRQSRRSYVLLALFAGVPISSGIEPAGIWLSRLAALSRLAFRFGG